jgi:hypothetical protein
MAKNLRLNNAAANWFGRYVGGKACER